MALQLVLSVPDLPDFRLDYMPGAGPGQAISGVVANPPGTGGTFLTRLQVGSDLFQLPFNSFTEPQPPLPIRTATELDRTAFDEDSFTGVFESDSFDFPAVTNPSYRGDYDDNTVYSLDDVVLVGGSAGYISLQDNNQGFRPGLSNSAPYWEFKGTYYAYWTPATYPDRIRMEQVGFFTQNVSTLFPVADRVQLTVGGVPGFYYSTTRQLSLVLGSHFNARLVFPDILIPGSVFKIQALTQVDYDALADYDAQTLYLIIQP